MKKSSMKTVILPLLLEKQHWWVHFCMQYESDAVWTDCGWAVGLPSEAERTCSSQTQLARVVCSCCCLSDTGLWGWLKVSCQRSVLYIDLEDILCMQNQWGNDMQGWIWRHTKHTEYLILQWQKDSIVAGLSVSHSPSLDVAEQHQFEGRQMLKHSRDMLVKEHTWENAIWEKVTFLGVAIDHKI